MTSGREEEDEEAVLLVVVVVVVVSSGLELCWVVYGGRMGVGLAGEEKDARGGFDLGIMGLEGGVSGGLGGGGMVTTAP